MPTKLNRAREQQSYVPKGNGDASGQYTNGSSSERQQASKVFGVDLTNDKQQEFNDVKIDTQSVNAYDNQEDLIKRIKVNGKNVGYVKYSVGDDEEPHIQMIEIDKDYRRRGLATKLLKDLQNDYPDKNVDFGMMTEEGKKLFESATIEKKNPQYAKIKGEYDKITQENEEIDKKWEQIWDDIDNGSSKITREEMEQLNEKWQNNNIKRIRLKEQLEQMVESKTLIK